MTDHEHVKPTPAPVIAEMERIKALFRDHDGDAEDLISYARNTARLRADLEMVTAERDEAREVLAEVAGDIRLPETNSVRNARAALRDDSLPPRTETPTRP